jgi:nucleotide-binding universal stress UspA family protein
MYTRMLIPLDGSTTGEQVLPYARTLARNLRVPVELLGVVDITVLASQVARGNARYFETLITESVRSSEAYLKRIAQSFPGTVKCTIEKGRPEEVIIEKAAADPGTLITMATHGRSGVDRFLLGSVTEKVLRGTYNALLLIRAAHDGKTDGEANLTSTVITLDGSELAESILPMVATMAKKLNLAVVLFRAYSIPYGAYAGDDGYSGINVEEVLAVERDEAIEYLEKKVGELKRLGIDKVSCVVKEGLSADEIIKIARETPDNFVAMCSHGRSGVKRWVLGSVTETVVRHSGDPVLVARAG